MSITHDDLTERVRLRLNSIPEKNMQGREQRFGAQLLTLFAGYLLTLSKNRNNVDLGTALCRGASASIGEMLGERLGKWLQEKLE